jgi:hypothetical protein
MPDAEKNAGCSPTVRCADRFELCPPACHAEWHVAIHADSDSLFRHSGALGDCSECRIFEPPQTGDSGGSPGETSVAEGEAGSTPAGNPPESSQTRPLPPAEGRA